MNRSDYSNLTEGRYVPHGDISYEVTLDRLDSDGKRHVIYTGTLPTYDIYEEKQTGYIAWSVSDHLDPAVDFDKHIEKNRWKQIVTSEINRQVEHPEFAMYNFSFLNSVHNSSTRTRA